MTNTTPDAGRASVPDPRPDAVEPQMGTGSAAASNPIPAIERNVDHTELEPGDTDTDPISVSAEVPESIEATIDFSEVELADEFAEPELAVTPGGLLPMEPSPIEGRLRKAPLRVPDELEECGGFTLFGRRIKSLLYTTDVAVIRNSNADAIFAVYPFTAQPAITQALLTASEAPVFVGVGGGTTTGKRSVQLAAVSEMQGAAGVVVNSPAPPEMIEQICAVIDIPVIATVVRCDAVAHAKVKAGAKILNVAAGKDTPAVLRELREIYPNLPLIRRSQLAVRSRDRPGGRQRRHLDAALGAAAPGRHDAPLSRGRSQTRGADHGPGRRGRCQSPRKRTRRRAHPRRADRQGNHRRPQAPASLPPALLQG